LFLIAVTLIQFLDLDGFIGAVTSMKQNNSSTRYYFTIHLKRKPTEFSKIIVSNHKSIHQVRTTVMDFFHNKEPVKFVNVLPGKEVFFYNVYSEVQSCNNSLDFHINDTDGTLLTDINDIGLVLSVVGKVKYTADTEVKRYMKNGRQRQDRMRRCVISDGTRSMQLTLWEEMIDVMREDTLIQFYCLSSKEYALETVLTSNFSSCVCYLTEDREITHDDALLKATVETADDTHLLIHDPKISSVKVNTFYSCKSCRCKLIIESGSEALCSNPRCKKGYSLDGIESMRNRSAQIEVEVGNSLIMVTAFTDVLSQFFGVLPQSENELRKSILNLKKICITYDNQKLVVVKIEREE